MAAFRNQREILGSEQMSGMDREYLNSISLFGKKGSFRSSNSILMYAFECQHCVDGAEWRDG